MERLYFREFVLVGLFAALIAAGPFIKIPLPFMTLTLQVLFVLLAGAVLRPVAAASAAGLYIFLGFIGLPVFEGMQSGLEVIQGGSGGYLLGYVLAALVISWMVGAKKMPIHQIALAMLVGLFIVYDAGMLRLAQVESLTLGQAFQFAVAPFVVGDLIKLAIAAVLAYKINQSDAFQTVFQGPEMPATSPEGIQDSEDETKDTEAGNTEAGKQ